jgi:ATP-dependent RNA helicase SUPV3L1/SUV3
VRRCSSKDVAVGHDRVQSARYLKELLMVEEGPGSVENDLPVAEPQPRHDFSIVQGFQVVGAEDHGGAQASDQAWRDALRLELEARAARLHQAVDAALVLSNDGIIRWLGDPVAKLSLGPNVLNPGVVIFADESLPDASRETIRTRIELWIAATTRRILAPLFALEGIQEGSEIVRDLAQELVRSLGVLEREPIKAKIKALAQDDRAELRKQGVRFGAYYIFVPALLKPAPRNLALQLWGLQAPGDASELLRTLCPVASSGRTSLSLDTGISKEGYRVAGYRPCGERIVRVDVLERLAGMIRAAIAGEAPGVADGRPSHRTSKGFIISGEMTSLTGCSGEPFASILRSMGFRPVEMKRSDFFGSSSASGSPAEGRSTAAAEDQGPSAGGHDQSSPLEIGEEECTTEAVLASEPAELLPDGGPEGAGAVPEAGGAASDAFDVVLEGADAVHGTANGVVVEATVALPVSAEPLGAALRADVAGEPAPPAQTSGSSGEPAKNADVIVVWRPDRRRPWPSREAEGKQSRSETSGRLDTGGHSPAAGRKWTRKAATQLPSKPNRPDPAQVDEKRRQRPRNYDMPRLNTTTAPQHQAKVDPNSPFAKLLELRSRLEEQANKRP